MRDHAGTGERGVAGPGRPAASDGHATRARLLAAAVDLFAEHGYQGVSVREICRQANANIAAVNYHFRDKLGLYLAVVGSAIDHMRDTSDLTKRVAVGSSAEARVRHYVRAYVERLMVAAGPTSWIHRLMRHETTAPTPAALQIFELAILPRIEYLASVVAEIMGCRPEDPRVTRCVVSVQAQCLFFRPDPFRAVIASKWPTAVESAEVVADHITEFSLAAMRTLAGAPRDAR